MPARSAIVVAAGVGALLLVGNGSNDVRTTTAAAARAKAPATTTTSTTTIPPTTTTTGPPSTTRTLRLADNITGPITPKSVVASGRGLVFAQNMIYKHSVTVYDSNFNLVATIPDTVDLSTLGHPEHPGAVQGGPVEAAFAPDGKDVYVSNYSMYGPGFPHPGDDTCSPAQNRDSSFVYRINVRSSRSTPPSRWGRHRSSWPSRRTTSTCIVSNWCSYDVSVVDPVTNQEVKRIPVARTRAGSQSTRRRRPPTSR